METITEVDRSQRLEEHSLAKTHRLGLLFWLGITILSLLVNPLPWQRYYLPLIPIVTLLAGFALAAILDYFLPKRQPIQASETEV